MDNRNIRPTNREDAKRGKNARLMERYEKQRLTLYTYTQVRNAPIKVKKLIQNLEERRS